MSTRARKWTGTAIVKNNSMRVRVSMWVNVELPIARNSIVREMMFEGKDRAPSSRKRIAEIGYGSSGSSEREKRV